MSDLRTRRIFFALALGAAALLGVLEVALARAGNPSVRPSAPWAAPLEEMDSALARADLSSAVTSRHRAHLAALGSRTWEGFLEVGDAALRLGEATGNRRAMEPQARRAYLAALTYARAQRSLEGVLRATESFARLGDRDMVVQGIRMAHVLAGKDDDAQARIAALEGLWIGDLL